MNVSANGSGGAPESPRLISRSALPANLIVRGARLFDPRAGLDETRDLVVRDGQIAELAEPGHDDVPNLKGVERLADASHWVHHDEAERVNRLLVDFFAAP